AASSMRATTSPTCTVSPSALMIESTPAATAGISTLALSVSNSSSGSSTCTVAPPALIQRTLTPSLTHPPSGGMRPAQGIVRRPPGVVEQFRRLGRVDLVRSYRRAGGRVPPGVSQRAAVAEGAPHAPVHLVPGSHVPRLLLHPQHLARPGVRRQR